MNRAGFRRVIRISLISLAFGAAATMGLNIWLCARSRVNAQLSVLQYQPWPAGTPEGWVRPERKETLETRGLHIDGWEYLADRSYMKFYPLAARDFPDRRSGTRAWVGSSSWAFDDALTGDPVKDKQAVARLALQKASLDKLVTQIEDRTAVRIVAGWPYASFRGTCWLTHRFNLTTQKWTTSVVDSRGIATLSAMPSDSPWNGLYPWYPVWPGFIGSSITYGSPVALACTAFVLMRRRYRQESGCCPACGYAVGWAHSCPECGRNGSIWTPQRLARLTRREGPARPRPILTGVSLLLIAITITTSLGVTAEFKARQCVVGVWAGALVLGVSDDPWKLPGPAVYLTPSRLEVVPRVSTVAAATRLFVPLWPGIAVLVTLLARGSWHRGICTRARDVKLRQEPESGVTEPHMISVAAAPEPALNP